jgi:Leucine-rich repeat (LRR) protein
MNFFSDSLLNTSEGFDHIIVNKELLLKVSKVSDHQLHSLQRLDLHIRDARGFKIKRIENLHLVPNLRFLNLSYNSISSTDGLQRLSMLVELNLAENSIKEVKLYS